MKERDVSREKVRRKSFVTAHELYVTYSLLGALLRNPSRASSFTFE